MSRLFNEFKAKAFCSYRLSSGSCFVFVGMLTACYFCGQRAGLGPPAELLSEAGVPDHQKVGKELAATVHVPPASPAGNLRRQALGAVRQNSLRAALYVQTRCRKNDDDAVALCGATASPKSLPSQAWAQGVNTGCRYQIASLSISIAAIAFNAWTSSQFRPKSSRPSAPTRLAAPVAGDSGCRHWHRGVPMLRNQICGNVFERSAASAQ